MKKCLAMLACLCLSACDGGRPATTGGGGAINPKAALEIVTIDSSPEQSALAPMPDADDSSLPLAILAYIPGSTPTKLVVMCHGWGQDATTVWRDHVLRTAREDVAVIASNYRDNDRFPIGKGAVDTLAATRLMKERFPSIEKTYMFGVSLGGAVSGTAISEAAALGESGEGLYDHWVAVEPLAMLVESYLEASAALPEVAANIEHDAGGTPFEVPAEYQRRTAVANVNTMANAGLKTITIVHSINDGLVPYNQARELALASSLAGIPTQMFTVARKEGDQESGTTGTGTILGVLGAPDLAAPLNLAGHGWEGDPNHPVIRTAFEQLELLLSDEYDETLPYFESLVDDG